MRRQRTHALLDDLALGIGDVPLRVGDGIAAAARDELKVTFAAAWLSVASVSLPASTVTSARATALASP